MQKLFVALACCVSVTVLAAEAKAADTKAKATEVKTTDVKSTPAAAAVPLFTPRKVTTEDKKGIDALIAAEEAAMTKGDMEASAANVDFPVYMVSDNAKGEAIAVNWDKKKYVDVMTASAQNMPKDAKMKHNRKYHFLTDTMALVTDDVSSTVAKTTQSWKSASLVVKKDGKWLWKSMMMGGWGDSPMMKEDAKGAGMSGSH
jgi:hypothetical protein